MGIVNDIIKRLDTYRKEHKDLKKNPKDPRVKYIENIIVDLIELDKNFNHDKLLDIIAIIEQTQFNERRLGLFNNNKVASPLHESSFLKKQLILPEAQLYSRQISLKAYQKSPFPTSFFAKQKPHEKHLVTLLSDVHEELIHLLYSRTIVYSKNQIANSSFLRKIEPKFTEYNACADFGRTHTIEGCLTHGLGEKKETMKQNVGAFTGDHEISRCILSFGGQSFLGGLVDEFRTTVFTNDNQKVVISAEHSQVTWRKLFNNTYCCDIRIDVKAINKIINSELQMPPLVVSPARKLSKVVDKAEEKELQTDESTVVMAENEQHQDVFKRSPSLATITAKAYLVDATPPIIGSDKKEYPYTIAFDEVVIALHTPDLKSTVIPTTPSPDQLLNLNQQRVALDKKQRKEFRFFEKKPIVKSSKGATLREFTDERYNTVFRFYGEGLNGALDDYSEKNAVLKLDEFCHQNKNLTRALLNHGGQETIGKFLGVFNKMFTRNGIEIRHIGTYAPELTWHPAKDNEMICDFSCDITSVKETGTDTIYILDDKNQLVPSAHPRGEEKESPNIAHITGRMKVTSHKKSYSITLEDFSVKLNTFMLEPKGKLFGATVTQAEMLGHEFELLPGKKPM